MLPAGGGVMQGMEDSLQGIPMQPGRPLSVCSVSSCGAGGPSPVHRAGNGLYPNCNGSNPQEEIMNDELLMSLSVRELNKRLHGCPREEVSQVSHFFDRTVYHDQYLKTGIEIGVMSVKAQSARRHRHASGDLLYLVATTRRSMMDC